MYLGECQDHWVGNKESLRPAEFAEIVRAYAQPGAARGSIAWYRAGGGSAQMALTAGSTPPVPIPQPTSVLWGEVDPILPSAWADRLGDTFTHLLGVQILPGIGHFVPFEAPDAVVEAVRAVLSQA
jgi:pimeloyl-ACP methyl ester carboxylesterase